VGRHDPGGHRPALPRALGALMTALERAFVSSVLGAIISLILILAGAAVIHWVLL